MEWTDLLLEPRAVTVTYGGAPSLRGFGLDDLNLAGDGVTLKGSFAQPPDPLPARWALHRYTHAGVTFRAHGVVEADVTGTPRLHFDARGCLMGDPVDLAVEHAGRVWASENGTEWPYVLLSGRSDFLSFRFVCTGLGIVVRGYTPAPY